MIPGLGQIFFKNQVYIIYTCHFSNVIVIKLNIGIFFPFQQ